MLLCRSELSAFDAIEHLVGMQAQSPLAPYVGLWTRLEGFQPDELVQLMNDREVVRIALMRNTVHLVTAEDCVMLRPLTQVIFDRDLRVNSTFAPRLRGVDIGALTAASRALVEESPHTNAELGALLREQCPIANNLFVSHADRSRVISETDIKTLRATGRLVCGSVLVGGFFRGLWQIRRQRGVATLHIESYGPLSNHHRDAVAAEGEHLLAFAASKAKSRDIEFTLRK
jgi:hypothetical protein